MSSADFTVYQRSSTYVTSSLYVANCPPLDVDSIFYGTPLKVLHLLNRGHTKKIAIMPF
ncbi:uncharacterized protein V1513DRAFT_425684 [Lipomyces chichibuensis]|uniref:uncharacterized protein n=1 Tax=Lipomyces chichibuensis TaxID=1546026 RepID=UPI003343B4A2